MFRQLKQDARADEFAQRLKQEYPRSVVDPHADIRGPMTRSDRSSRLRRRRDPFAASPAFDSDQTVAPPAPVRDPKHALAIAASRGKRCDASRDRKDSQPRKDLALDPDPSLDRQSSARRPGSRLAPTRQRTDSRGLQPRSAQPLKDQPAAAAFDSANHEPERPSRTWFQCRSVVESQINEFDASLRSTPPCSSCRRRASVRALFAASEYSSASRSASPAAGLMPR